MKIFKFLTILTLTLSTLTLDCTPGCAKCSAEGKCLQCYKTPTIDSKCPELETPYLHCRKSNPDGTCAVCDPYYVGMQPFLKTPNPEQGFCAPGLIPRCEWGQYVDTTGTVQQCIQCMNGIPTEDFYGCLRWVDMDDKERLPNCVSGRRYLGVDQKVVVECGVCKSGFVSVKGACEDAGKLEGCLWVDKQGGACEECDLDNGWYMKSLGVCVKGA